MIIKPNPKKEQLITDNDNEEYDYKGNKDTWIENKQLEEEEEEVPTSWISW